MNRLLSFIAAPSLLPRNVRFQCGFIFLFFASCASAAVFERDWKTPGDGLLTYDNVNQRVWLDLSVSQLTQFPEPRLVNAIAEIAPGGLFEGFTWAKRDDVVGLVLSAGIDPGTRDYAVNGPAATQLIDLLSPTVNIIQTVRSVGLINEVVFVNEQVGADIWVRFDPLQAGISIASRIDTVGPATNGLMLYRNVPEPTTDVIFASAIGGFGVAISFRRKRETALAIRLSR